MASSVDLWRELLYDLALVFEMPLLLRWFMSNGAIIQMLLPQPGEIEKESLVEDLEFPFKFNEIKTIRIEDGVPEFTPPSNIEERLREILKRHPGYQISKEDNSITIKLLS